MGNRKVKKGRGVKIREQSSEQSSFGGVECLWDEQVLTYWWKVNNILNLTLNMCWQVFWEVPKSKTKKFRKGMKNWEISHS